MTENSPRLNLPFIQPSQAQKHVTHNEAIEILDTIVNLKVETVGLDTPPLSPTEGQTWVIGASPTGAWANQPSMIASYRNAGWLFLEPSEGWLCWDTASAQLQVLISGNWQAIAPTLLEGISGLGINATSDPGNPLSVSGPASLFTHSGTDHQLKVNKASVGDSASVILQTGFSGRAELGLNGNDDFSVKVSADGTNWENSLTVNASGERVTIDKVLRLAPISEPLTALSGDVYFDSTSNKLRCYDGVIWHDLF